MQYACSLVENFKRLFKMQFFYIEYASVNLVENFKRVFKLANLTLNTPNCNNVVLEKSKKQKAKSQKGIN